MSKLIYKIKRKFTRGYTNNINYETLKKIMAENKNVWLIDVRNRDEYNYKHIPGAINIPMQYICARISNYVSDKSNIIILYCQYGGRSAKALKKLEKMGYSNLYNLDGGIEAI